MVGHPNTRCALLADPHYPLIERLHNLLETHFDSVFVVADANSLLEGMQRLQPAVVILDLAIARGRLGDLVVRMKGAAPHTALIVLTVHEAPAVAEAALAVGLDGVVLKRLVARDLLPAVDTVLGHNVFVSAELACSPAGKPEIR